MKNKVGVGSILIKDEEVLVRIKPNLFKYVLHTFFAQMFFVLFLNIALFVGCLLVPELYVYLYYLLAITGAYYSVLIFVKTLQFKNAEYFITNNRIILQFGTFTKNFKSLEIASLKKCSVVVGVLDRFAKVKTGTILFGSSSAPIMPQHSETIYKMMHVQDAVKYKKFLEDLAEKEF